MMNAGKYNHKIKIVDLKRTKDAAGFPIDTETIVLEPWASVRTTRGYTLISSGSDFESATTNFTIRYPVTKIKRDMVIKFRGKTYTIEYLNNVNEEGKELEIQAREVTH